jgi:hypothetical protein
VASSVWTFWLMLRTPGWHTSLRPVLLLAGLAAAGALLWLPLLRKAFLPAVATAALIASLAAPALAAVATAAETHSGAIPAAAPSTGNGFGPRTRGGPPGGGFGGRGGGGGVGNLLRASTASAELVAALKVDSARYSWVAAAIGSNSAAGPQLATGLPVMAIGGFNGSDPTPTLAAFQALVAAGRVHYFLGGTGSGTAAQISSWVAGTFTAQTIGGTTVYDLTTPKA